jgi:hypothetical protein
MGESWKRMLKRTEFPGVGWIRNVEVTRSTSDEAHPHYHALLMVSPGYFSGRNYVSQKNWVQLWRSCLRVDYNPHVRVNAIRLKHHVKHGLLTRRSDEDIPDSDAESLTNQPEVYAYTEGQSSKVNAFHAYSDVVDANLHKAISYTLKYSVKPGEFLRDLDDPEASKAWLAELTKQLHKTKAVALGGVFRDYLRESKGESDEDFIHSQSLLESEANDDVERIYVAWAQACSRYKINP